MIASNGQRNLYAGAAVLVAGFLTYGSLYPFEFVYPAPASAWNRLVTPLPEDVHLGNILSNLLLFVPLGLAVTRAIGSRARGLLVSLALGLLLGVCLQVAQVFLPTRIPSLWDAAWNIAGAGVGALIPLHTRRLGGHNRGPQAVLALGLIALWIAVKTFPFVPTLDWQALKAALKPLLLDPQIHTLALLADLVGWAALARLWRGRARLPWPRSGPWLVFGVVLIAQVLVVHRAPDLSGVVGGLAGLLLALVLPGTRRQAIGLLTLLILWLVAAGLDPMIFRDTPGAFHWLPLAGFLEDNMLHGIWVGLEKAFWFGLLLELMLAAGFAWRYAVVAGLLLLGGLEWTQRWIVTDHVAEITDPLIFLALALARRFYVHRRTETAVPVAARSYTRS